MFQSIKYLSHTHDNKTKLFNFHYEITDSDFISTSYAVVQAATPTNLTWIAAAEGAAAPSVLIKTYESKNYTHQEIIGNLFLLNLCLLKQKWYDNIKQILEYQNTYLTKEYYPESNFHEKYYDDLVKYTNKMMVLL